MAQGDISRKLQRIQDQMLQEPEKWVHYAADLTREGDVLSLESDRPITRSARLQQLGHVIGTRPPARVFYLAERILTPQFPYQQSPLSYLKALPAWDLEADLNGLTWSADWYPVSAPLPPQLQFFFLNVTPDTTGLVSIHLVEVWSVDPNSPTGSFDVIGSSNPPVNFPFTARGVADVTLDVVVYPTDPLEVSVWLFPKEGLGEVSFGEVSYTTLFSGPPP